MLHTLCCGWKWESLFHTLPGSLSLFFYVSWFCTLSAMFSPLLISVYFLIYVSNCGIKMLWCWLCLKAVESEQEIPHLIPDKHDEDMLQSTWCAFCPYKLKWLQKTNFYMPTKNLTRDHSKNVLHLSARYLSQFYGAVFYLCEAHLLLFLFLFFFSVIALCRNIGSLS